MFLLGSHKSGTSLLRSLLDGHPELSVLPTETHFFQYGGYGVNYALRRAHPDPAMQEEPASGFLRFIAEHSQVSDRFSDAPEFSGYDEASFRRSFSALPGDAPALVLTRYLRALHEAVYGAPVPVGHRVVEKSVEHSEFAPTLKSFFPDARFIHIVRNPYATLVALRKSKQRGGYPCLNRLARSLATSYVHLFNNRKLVPDYLVIRYEDLVTRPREAVDRIAAFLQIEGSPSLLHPTMMGQPWAGNSTSRGTFQGISQDTLERWKNSVNHLEEWVVEATARPVLDAFDYAQRTPSRSRWMPVRGEWPRAYVRNRSLLADLKG